MDALPVRVKWALCDFTARGRGVDSGVMTSSASCTRLRGIAALIMVAVVMTHAGCSRKKDAEPTATSGDAPVQTNSAVAVEPAPLAQPDMAFPDAARQRRYEAAFRAALGMYEAPQPGGYIWFDRCDGSRVGGQVMRADETCIWLRTMDGPQELKQADIAGAFRPQVFAADFAREQAMRALAATDGPPATVSGAPMRFPLADGLRPRQGPGYRFKAVSSSVLHRGEVLKVLEERDGWVRVVPAERPAPGAGGWVPKFETFPLSELVVADRTADVEWMKKIGALSAVDIRLNTARVQSATWMGSSPDCRNGYARALAAYCAASKGSSLIYTTIVDERKRRLATYSGSQGWREFVSLDSM